MSKIPDYYKAPLRSRSKIVDYLLHMSGRDEDRRGGHNYEYCRCEDSTHRVTLVSRGPWMFAWNVKIRHVDFSFDGLLQRHLAQGYTKPEDPRWDEEARLQFEGIDKDVLFETAQSDIVREVIDDDEGARGRVGDEGLSELWCGTSVDPRFMLAGRSAGWLILAEFCHQVLDEKSCRSRCDSKRKRKMALGLHVDIDLYFTDWSFRDLFKLYRYVVQMDADLRRTSPGKRIELAAASLVFDSYLSHITPQLVRDDHAQVICDQAQVACNWP